MVFTCILTLDSITYTILSIATILLKIRQFGGTTLKVSIPAYRTSPFTGGGIFMDFPAGALDTPGTFTGEIELTYSSGKIQTVFDEIKFEVRGEY